MKEKDGKGKGKGKRKGKGKGNGKDLAAERAIGKGLTRVEAVTLEVLLQHLHVTASPELVL